MIRISSPGCVLSEVEVEGLEATLGSTLPEPYREFLLAYNGGRPVPDGIVIPGYDETDVQVIFGVGRQVESSCIDWNLRLLESRLPDGLLPIATDSGGNLFCLSLRREDRGAVLYADLESVFGELGIAPIHMVCSSFTEFLNCLIE